jgi:transposase-like protein
MVGKILGVERRRRWSKGEKARIVEEALMPGVVVSEVPRRHGAAQSLLFTWSKAGAHGGTGQERRLDFASGRDRSDGGAVRIGGGETVAPGDERTPNEVRRHRNRTLAARRIASPLVHRSVRSLPRPMPATPFISAALTAVYTDRVYDHFITPQHVIKVSLNYKPY